MIKRIALGVASAALMTAGIAGTAAAEAEKYTFDASHSQVVFSYNHLGFSTTYGMFSGFDGEAMLDADNPANSSVTTSWAVSDMFTGWEKRDAHLLSDDFLKASANPTVSFTSTGVEMTGETSAKITGDLTVAGMTQEVVLDATLNRMADHPMEKAPWAGFDATTTIMRSDFGAGNFAPFIGDEVEVMISVEMRKAI